MVSWSNVVDMQVSSFNYNIKKTTEYIWYIDERSYRIQIYICGERMRSLRALIRNNIVQHDYIWNITYVRKRYQ